MLRKDEKEISKLSRYRIKIVKRTGTRLGDGLRNKGPNYGNECGRESCHPCKARNSQKKRYPCWDRSVLYRAFCLKCKEEGKVAEYIGETGKSVFQCSSNHYDSVKYRRSSLFMLRHQLRSHPEEDPFSPQFGWEIISKEPTCIRRQVKEALLIKESRDKEDIQRLTIIKEYKPEPKPKPKPDPEPRLEPEPEPKTETRSEPGPRPETESEPGPGAGQTNQDINPNPNTVENPKHKRKSKPKPKPPPESHIVSKLTHINLNNKLEYNRSTIPTLVKSP